MHDRPRTQPPRFRRQPQLVAAQQGVVDLPAAASGLVVGAAGTGKTTALRARAARILEEGIVSPDELMILTPTRQSATRLRDTIADGLDLVTSGPLARSVASFAFQIVRASAVAAGEPTPQLLTAPDQDSVIADLLEGDELDAAEGRSRWPDDLGPAVRRSRAFRTEMRALFALAVELGIDPQTLQEVGRARRFPGWVAAGSFWGEYRYVLERLRPSHRDPAELLRDAAAVLQDPATPLPTRMIMVDDAQELTPGAVTLLQTARDRGVALLAFADPDVASGAFRGAGPETFARLAADIGQHVVLRQQFRSRPALTRAARTVAAAIGTSGVAVHRLAPDDGLPADDRPPADDGSRGDLQTYRAASPHEEIDAIAYTLRTWHLRDGVPWHRLAVIAHDTRQIARLSAELSARDVPTGSGSAGRPLGEEPAVRGLIQLVRLGIAATHERTSEEIAAALTSPFGGLDAVGLRRLRAALRAHEFAGSTRRGADELLAEALAQPAGLLLIDTPSARIAERLARTLAEIHAAANAGGSAHELLWIAWDRSGLAEPWRARARTGGVEGAQANRSLDALVALFAAAKRAAEREDEDPQRFLVDVLGSEVPEDSLAYTHDRDLVDVLTPAAALAREFDAVVIGGVQDGVWPNTRLRGGLLEGWRLADDVEAYRRGVVGPDPEVLDRRRGILHEELRLFERALTRARSRVLVTAVDDEDQSPSVLFSWLPDPVPRRTDRHPRTLRGAVAAYRRQLTEAVQASHGVHDADLEAVAEYAARQLAVLAEAGVPGADPESWYGVAPRSGAGGIHDLSRAPVSISPSRIEAFEECGVDWAIRELGGDSRSFSAGLGTILHAAMESAPEGSFPQLDEIVEQRWGELDFESDWLSRQERSWARTLTRRLATYLHEFVAEGGTVVATEARFRIAITGDAASGASDAVHSRSPEVVACGPGSVPDGAIAVISGSVDRLERRGPRPPSTVDTAATSPSEDSPAKLVVVDLKTGRSEARVSDEKVAGNAQLAAYQLALEAGAVDGCADAELDGARLLVLSKTLKNTAYRIAHQPRLDRAERAALLERIVADARAMAADSFTAYPDVHCADDHFAVCRLHTVKPVSAT